MLGANNIVLCVINIIRDGAEQRPSAIPRRGELPYYIGVVDKCAWYTTGGIIAERQISLPLARRSMKTLLVSRTRVPRGLFEDMHFVPCVLPFAVRRPGSTYPPQTTRHMKAAFVPSFPT